MDEWLKVLQQLPKELQDDIEKQYELFTSMHSKGYIIGIDLSNTPDQTVVIRNG